MKIREREWEWEREKGNNPAKLDKLLFAVHQLINKLRIEIKNKLNSIKKRERERMMG